VQQVQQVQQVQVQQPQQWGQPRRNGSSGPVIRGGGAASSPSRSPARGASQVVNQTAGLVARQPSPGVMSPLKQEPRRPIDRCHQELYEDAFARQQRMRELMDTALQAQEREEQLRALEWAEGMKQRKATYRLKDRRTHLEREQEAMKRRKEILESVEEQRRRREEEELRKCTFRPSLVKKLNTPADHRSSATSLPHTHGGAPGASAGRALSPHRLASPGSSPRLRPSGSAGVVRQNSPRGGSPSGGSPKGDYSAAMPLVQPGGSPGGGGSAIAGLAVLPKSPDNSSLVPRLCDLVERQRCAADALKALASEDGKLREKLRAAHTELYNNILREETQRVVQMLQDAHSDESEGSTKQKELIRRVSTMVAAGSNPETAQKMIVDELVGQSQEEVQRRVLEAFLPMRFEAEGALYTRRLSFVHELESVEAQVVALRGGTLFEEAKALGFEFGLAEQGRKALRSGLGAPSPSGSACLTPGMGSLTSAMCSAGNFPGQGSGFLPGFAGSVSSLAAGRSGKITPQQSNGHPKQSSGFSTPRESIGSNARAIAASETQADTAASPSGAHAEHGGGQDLGVGSPVRSSPISSRELGGVSEVVACDGSPSLTATLGRMISADEAPPAAASAGSPSPPDGEKEAEVTSPAHSATSRGVVVLSPRAGGAPSVAPGAATPRVLAAGPSVMPPGMRPAMSMPVQHVGLQQHQAMTPRTRPGVPMGYAPSMGAVTMSAGLMAPQVSTQQPAQTVMAMPPQRMGTPLLMQHGGQTPTMTAPVRSM